MKGEDVFILGGKVHWRHSDAVHIFVLETLAHLANSGDVLVENLSCQEVGPCRAFEGGAHLHHPVHHLGPVLLGYLVSHDWNGDSTWRLVLALGLGFSRIFDKLFLLEAFMVVFKIQVMELILVVASLAELDQLLILGLVGIHSDRYLWQWNSALVLRLCSQRFQVFWGWCSFRVMSLIFGKIFVFSIQVINLDRIRNIREIGVYSQGSNFVGGYGPVYWAWGVGVWLEVAPMNVLDFTLLDSESWSLDWVFGSQRRKPGSSRVHAILWEESTGLSWCYLLSLDTCVAIWSGSWVFWKVNSVLTNVHDGVSCVFLVGHFEWCQWFLWN